jgi:hypothetical protein
LTEYALTIFGWLVQILVKQFSLVQKDLNFNKIGPIKLPFFTENAVRLGWDCLLVAKHSSLFSESFALRRKKFTKNFFSLASQIFDWVESIY